MGCVESSMAKGDDKMKTPTSPNFRVYNVTSVTLALQYMDGRSIESIKSEMGAINGSARAPVPEPPMLLLIQLDENVKKIQKPKPWKHSQPITRTQLNQMRDEFWDTAPHYGGRKEIWDALRAAAEADISLAQAIVDSAGVIIASADLTTCYDERGAKYELPKYVLSEPTNLMRDS